MATTKAKTAPEPGRKTSTTKTRVSRKPETTGSETAPAVTATSTPTKPAASKPAANSEVGIPAASTANGVDTLLVRFRDMLGSTESKIFEQMDAFRQDLATRLAPAPAPTPTPVPSPALSTTFDEDMEGIARTVKRAMVEVYERNSDRMAVQLAKVCRHIGEATKQITNGSGGARDHLAACTEELTALLTELGVESYDAQVGEHFDPMIHQCAADRSQNDVEPGRVLEAIAPGYRSWRGTIVLPALTVVNRR